VIGATFPGGKVQEAAKWAAKLIFLKKKKLIFCAQQILSYCAK
jgi:hypothetical protein